MRFAIFSLLFVLIISLASASSAEEQLDKRNTCSDYYKRDVLDKRNYKKCPCAVADTSFDNVQGFSGFMALTQDECGRVKVIGQFFGGFAPGVNHTFQIVDPCGKVIADLGDLGVQPNGSGGTQPIDQTFTSFNINCDSSGIKFVGSHSYKRNCYSKRQAGSGGASMQITTPGNTPASSSINYP